MKTIGFSDIRIEIAVWHWEHIGKIRVRFSGWEILFANRMSTLGYKRYVVEPTMFFCKWPYDLKMEMVRWKRTYQKTFSWMEELQFTLHFDEKGTRVMTYNQMGLGQKAELCNPCKQCNAIHQNPENVK